jgi:hypothetical protein
LFGFTCLTEKHNPCPPVVPVGWLVLNYGMADAGHTGLFGQSTAPGESLAARILHLGKNTNPCPATGHSLPPKPVKALC